MKKKLIICLFMAFSLSAKSQWVIPQKKIAAYKKKKASSININSKIPKITIGRDSFYILPLDNMPCFVPNTDWVAKIPNAALNFKPAFVPNGKKE